MANGLVRSRDEGENLTAKVENLIITDKNGEFEVTLPNDRDYTVSMIRGNDENDELRGSSEYEGQFKGINGVESVFVSKEELQSETDGVYEGALPLRYIKDVGLITNLEEFREEFLRLLNEERQSLGLGTVEYNAVLNEVAEERAQYVVDNKHFSHFVVPTAPPHEVGDLHPARILFDRGYDYDTEIHNIMENLAGAHLEATAEDVFENWKSSEGHYRAFLVEDYKYIGLDYTPSNSGGYTVIYIGSSTNF